MVINFNTANGANSAGRTAQADAAAGKRDVAVENNATDKPGVDKSALGESSVKLSDQAQQMKSIEARLKDLPEVDSERVAQLKQAIADGSYKPDSSRIADKLLGLED